MNTGLLAFEAAARINRADVDIRAIARQYGITGEPAPEELLRIAKGCGFRAKLKSLPLNRLAESYPLPAIAVDKSGAYRLVLKIDGAAGKLLLFNPAVRKTEETTITEFEEANDRFIVLGSRAATSSAAFGFRWFLAEIATFKRIIGEVLLGSFVVQSFGLVTPIFTQVILDKVLVHRTLTTLDVLAVAFLAVAVFELFLNIARNYIFQHTAAKLDAKLGAKLFRHLLGLPFRYFETRKVQPLFVLIISIVGLLEHFGAESPSINSVGR